MWYKKGSTDAPARACSFVSPLRSYHLPASFLDHKPHPASTPNPSQRERHFSSPTPHSKITMKDTLRQPDGKIRTACNFCRQRKKRCSGEMPCASCVNFNRDCCVYERWSSTPPAPKNKEAPVAMPKFPWIDQPSSTSQTAPCFTSKVLLRRIQEHKNESGSHNENPPVSPTSSKYLQPPFEPLLSLKPLDTSHSRASPAYSYSSASPSSSHSLSTPSLQPDFSWSPTYDSPDSYMSMPLTPVEAMSRTMSLPHIHQHQHSHHHPHPQQHHQHHHHNNKNNNNGSSSSCCTESNQQYPWMTSFTPIRKDESPLLLETSMASPMPGVMGCEMTKAMSMPSFDAQFWSQPSTPSSLSTPISPTEDVFAMLAPAWNGSCLEQNTLMPNNTLPNDAETKQLLRDVDALLLEYGNAPTTA